jgi:hypothetical protein
MIVRGNQMMDETRIRALVDAVVIRVAELPDRTSPDDWPDAMLVTADELRGIVSDELDAALQAASPSEALMSYVEHRPTCKAYRYPGIGTCGCGLAEARKQAASPVPRVETLPLLRNDDRDQTCLFCSRDNCEWVISLRGYGRGVWIGLHKRCASELIARMVKP